MRKLKLEELNRLGVREFKAAEKIPVVVVLDNIRSALNVGSIFRTSDAMAIQEVVLCGITAQPPHKEINKTAIGSTKSVTWSYQEDITASLNEFKQRGYKLIGVEQTDESISLADYQIATSQPTVLIMGNEVEGLSDACLSLLDLALELPQYGTKHSLNVAVCAGIVLWEFAQAYRMI